MVQNQQANSTTGANAPDNSKNNPNSQNPASNSSNVIRPQQTSTLNNASNKPLNQQNGNPKQVKQSSVKKKSEDEMSSYEKRFITFVKNKFGGMIGETLMNTELEKYNISDLSLLDETQQVQIMEKVVEDVFAEHNMPSAQEQTKMELKIQLALDKAIVQLKELYNSVEIDYVRVEHNDSSQLDKYNSDTVKAWCTFGELTGQPSGKIYLFTSERETMMMITDYAKKKNLEFNPLDEKQKNETLFSFFSTIFNSFVSSLNTIIPTNFSYKFTETKNTGIELVEDIKKEIDEQEKQKNSRVDVISVNFKIVFERQEFPIRLFLSI